MFSLPQSEYDSLTEIVNRWSGLQNDGSFESNARSTLLAPLAALRGLCLTVEDAATMPVIEIDINELDLPDDVQRSSQPLWDSDEGIDPAEEDDPNLDWSADFTGQDGDVDPEEG